MKEGKHGGHQHHRQDKRERASAELPDPACIVASGRDPDDKTRNDKGNNCYTNGIDKHRSYWVEDGWYGYKPWRVARGDCETEKQASDKAHGDAKREGHFNCAPGELSSYISGTLPCLELQISR